MKRYLPAGIAACSVIFVAALAHGATLPARVTVLCQAGDGQQRITKTFVIDYSESTVNGITAHISGSNIDWYTKDTVSEFAGSQFAGRMHHSLNRLNGDYRWHLEGIGTESGHPTYRCSVAPAAIF
jgi:hypothetical protein